MRNLFFSCFIFLVSFSGMAQCSVLSTDGYLVSFNIRATSLTKINNGGGCTYKVNLSYEISFSGTNIPSSMYTLQGDIRCNGVRIFFDLPNSGGSGTVVSSNASYSGDCSGLTVENLCNEVRIQIHGPGISDRRVVCPMAMLPAPLPVDLLLFEGNEKNNAIKLSWATASERTNDYFTLEHSLDGEHFETIHQITGAGTSNVKNEYAFTDQQAKNGVNYYRLTQTDYNGEKEVFDVIAVMLNSQSEISSTVFPNPTQEGKINLKVNLSKIETLTYEVYNLQGKLIDKRDFFSQKIEILLPGGQSNYFLHVLKDGEIIGRHKIAVL